MSLTEIDREVEKLTPEERLDLISRIWDSLPGMAPPPIPEWHKRLLDERIANTNPDDEVDWEDFREELRNES
jgi:putative addiction module component (TIGR02574 family)